jgi:hypothetical protein
VGDATFNGTQHGNAIFYINASADQHVDDSRTCNATISNVTGNISGNTISGYQKNGITAKCLGVNVTISDNTVTGANETTQIAQNGIEVGVGATGTVDSNTVSENEYTGTNNADSTGLLVFGGGPFGALSTGVSITNNTFTDNDIGIDSVNCGDADCTVAPRTDTNILISGNTLSNPDVSNVSGCSGTQGYQAAIQELGRNDKIKQNKISGTGYTANGVTCGSSTTAAVFSIDRSAAQGPPSP